MNNAHEAIENGAKFLWMIFFLILIIAIVSGFLIWKFKNR